MTRNREDYLKVIYELGGQYKKVNNKNISMALGVSAPSVSEMINKLLKDEYVEYSSYQGVILTPLGLEKAMEIKRRHLLWEVFLVEKLGYGWEDVHEEAEKLEHVTTPRLEDLLDKYLNYPKVCPHGSPIISKGGDGTLEYTSVYDLSQGEKAVIKRFVDNKELLKYIEKINFKIGDKIELVNKDMKGKSVKIKHREKEIKMGLEFAKDIYVK